MANNVRLVVTSQGQRDIDAAAQRFLEHIVAEQVLETAKRLVPVRSGELRESLEIRKGTDAKGHATVGIGSDLDYAAVVEVGTSDTPAQSYLRAALKQTQL